MNANNNTPNKNFHNTLHFYAVEIWREGSPYSEEIEIEAKTRTQAAAKVRKQTGCVARSVNFLG